MPQRRIRAIWAVRTSQPAAAAFFAAGQHRWTLGVDMQRGLQSHRYWNIGARIGRKLHVITIRIG